MFGIKLIFWLAVFVLFYVYLGYPLLLGMIAPFRKKEVRVKEVYEDTVSLIISAYNEEGVVAQKIAKSLQLDYPHDRLEIMVVSEASTDRTDEIVNSYAAQDIKLLSFERSKGRTSCHNEAAEISKGELLVLSDANSMYEPNAIQKLTRHFSDERIECVCGQLRYRGGRASVEGERTYWKYDHAMKKLESKLSSLLTANGAIYAVRKSLYVPLQTHAINDFMEPLKIVQSGSR